MPNVRIDVDANIDRVRTREQSGDPSTPTAGYGWIFQKNDKKFYAMDSTGKVIPLGGGKIYTFAIPGTLQAEDGKLRMYNTTGGALTISKVHIAVNSAPTGAAIIIDIHKNGTTIFTTQSNRPQIAISGFTGQSTTIEVPSWADGDYLQMDVDQIGSTLAGNDLVVQVEAS